MNLKSRSGWLLMLPLLGLTALAGAAPFGEALFTSFRHDVFGQSRPAGLENYRYLFADRGFSYSLNISFLWAALNTALLIGLALLLAWRLSRREGGRKGLYLALLVPWGTPVYIAVPLWRAFFHGDGGLSLFSLLTGLEINLLTDPAGAFMATLWVSLWLSLPFTVFLFWGGMRKIPVSLIEAARMDGAGEGLIFRAIFLPQVREMIAALGILNFIKFLKEFNVVYLMTAGGPPLVAGITERHIIGATTTIDVLLYEIFGASEDLGITSAYSVVLAGLVIFAMLFWLAARRDSWRRPGGIGLTVLSQLIFNGTGGLLWAIVYALGYPLGRKWFKAVLALQLLSVSLALLRSGFLEGFSPALPLAFLGYLLVAPSEGPAIVPIRRTKTVRRLRRLLRRGRDGLLGALPFFSALGGLLTGGSALLILFLLIWLSFSGVGACYIDSLLPPLATPDNFIRLIREEGIFKYFWNTFRIAGATALLVPFFVLPAAQFLSRRSRRTAFFVLTGLQIIGLTGGMHSLIPLYALFRRIGLLGTTIPLVIIYLNHSLSVGLFTSLTYIEKIPDSFHDAALIEGARPWTYFRKVLLPLSLPVVFTTAILAFLEAWNGFMAPLLFLNDEAGFTISVKLFSLVGGLASGTPRWNLFAAASVINCLLIGILFYRFRRPLQTTALADETPF